MIDDGFCCLEFNRDISENDFILVDGLWWIYLFLMLHDNSFKEFSIKWFIVGEIEDNVLNG